MSVCLVASRHEMNKPGASVVVGMSGGVDSSVAALLLLQSGYRVEGLFMKNWEEDDGRPYCTAAADLADARAVCDKLGIPLHEANFAAEYWDNVFAHFLTEYKRGRTPNPDVLCNREIKFKVFTEYAQLLGADMIATGHYARLKQIDGEVRLCKGLDADKDQSYFLQSVPQEALSRVLFPLGELDKSRVRAIARAADLPTHAKKDSTGICFIGERRFKDFLKTWLPEEPGDIVTPAGRRVGGHDGLMYHTLGQRQGLGIGGIKNTSEAPWYVIDKDLTRNHLIVVQGNSHPALFCNHLTLNDIHWIGSAPSLPLICMVQTRYRQPDQPCQVKMARDGDRTDTSTDKNSTDKSSTDKKGYAIAFDRPQRSVTPGQWACLYQGDICLGGGIIESTDAGHALNEPALHNHSLNDKRPRLSGTLAS